MGMILFGVVAIIVMLTISPSITGLAILPFIVVGVLAMTALLGVMMVGRRAALMAALNPSLPRPAGRQSYPFDLAILVDPDEKLPPSDARALTLITRALAKQEIHAELIRKDDFKRLNAFDALFIRETTSVMHHTYRFARRAEAEGLVVIDYRPKPWEERPWGR